MPANRAAIDKAGRRLFGNELEIRLTLVERHPAPSVTPAETPASEAERLRREIGEQPAVHALTEVFGAEMIDVKPIVPNTDPPAEAE